MSTRTAGGPRRGQRRWLLLVVSPDVLLKRSGLERRTLSEESHFRWRPLFLDYL